MSGICVLFSLTHHLPRLVDDRIRDLFPDLSPDPDLPAHADLQLDLLEQTFHHAVPDMFFNFVRYEFLYQFRHIVLFRFQEPSTSNVFSITSATICPVRTQALKSGLC